MNHTLNLYNSLTRKKEHFTPLHEPFVGMYVCGPTVYSNSHLGHARPAVTFDLLYRWLLYLGYKVRYVRNITDVGHLENEVDETGEDRIGKKARQEHLEPMEVVQKYMNTFHKNMTDLNTLPPSIEPRASGHIIEQQELIRILIRNGYAYESNGSVYFDVERYNKKYKYGKLSGRVLEDQMSNTRTLEGGDEKRSPYDFALWKKAAPEHIMRWPSEWSAGFPGWHLECSAMSTKYLGNEFDIHGGGMDLLFPHHECELAQSSAALGHDTVRYWVHNNMITINGQKMARSLGNFITLDELFSGEHKLLTSSYSPMTIRFFILQAHYRSTLDFSNEALQAAEKGLQRLIKGVKTIESIKPSTKSTADIDGLVKKCHDSMNDDLNSPIVLSHLFDGIRIINSAAEGKEQLTGDDITKLSTLYRSFVFDIMGLRDEAEGASDIGLLPGVVDSMLNIRQELKEQKNWAMSDRIRDELLRLGIVVKDRKDGFDWELK